jgi:tRNA(Ser,Leu) C12 N-acetylase TAN1
MSRMMNRDEDEENIFLTAVRTWTGVHVNLQEPPDVGKQTSRSNLPKRVRNCL